MSSKPVLKAEHLQKVYHVYPTPVARLKQALMGERRQYFKPFTALKDLSLTMHQGDVVGIVGTNGSGKSTFLQIACGTLTPSAGHIEVNGRIAALLELGAGFNPDFTGRENVFLAASLMGLSREQTAERLDEIIAFSGIEPFIDQPVKTYSSGMFVRLAFSLATSVDPDILIIDEALSVGDGDFSKRSFDRIMQMRDDGKSILFCSHSLFQVENLCNRVLWINQGEVVADGDPEVVIPEYQNYLDRLSLPKRDENSIQPQGSMDSARIHAVEVQAGEQTGQELDIISGETDLKLDITFNSPPGIATPGVAVVIHSDNGLLVTSCGTWDDGHVIERTPNGQGRVKLVMPGLSLLKGRYRVGVLLYCDRGLYAYDNVDPVAFLNVSQRSAARGLVKMEHYWSERKTAPTETAGAPTEGSQHTEPVIDFLAVQALYQRHESGTLSEQAWHWLYPQGAPEGFIEYDGLSPRSFIAVQPLQLHGCSARAGRTPLCLSDVPEAERLDTIQKLLQAKADYDYLFALTEKPVHGGYSIMLKNLTWPAQRWTTRSLGIRRASSADLTLFESIWSQMQASMPDVSMIARTGRYTVQEHLSHPLQDRECLVVFNRLSGKVVAWCILLEASGRLELVDFAAPSAKMPALIRLLRHVAYSRGLQNVGCTLTPKAAECLLNTQPVACESNLFVTDWLNRSARKTDTLADHLWLLARDVEPLKN